MQVWSTLNINTTYNIIANKINNSVTIEYVTNLTHFIDNVR